jgi:hypothetical protein
LLAASADVASILTAIRIERPLRQGIDTRPDWELRLRSFHDCSAADLEWADVLILQRGLSRRACRLARAMHASGGKVVYEIDDLLTAMPPSLISHAFVQRRLPWLGRCLAAADVVTVSTARLGRSLGAPRWVEIPNYGDTAPPVDVAGARLSGAETLPAFILASSDHVPVAELALALRDLQAQPGRIGPVLAIGPVASDLVQAGVAIRPIAPMPRPDFLRLIRSSGPLLALIPLGETAFDACKSAIKYFDYALAGVPTLCANRPPYSDVIQDGIDGVLVEDRSGVWLAAIQRALDDPKRMAALAASAHRSVAAQHSLARCVAAWLTLLDELGPRRAAPRPAMNPLQRAIDDVTRWARRRNRQRLAARAARAGASARARLAQP